MTEREELFAALSRAVDKARAIPQGQTTVEDVSLARVFTTQILDAVFDRVSVALPPTDSRSERSE